MRIEDKLYVDQLRCYDPYSREQRIGYCQPGIHPNEGNRGELVLQETGEWTKWEEICPGEWCEIHSELSDDDRELIKIYYQEEKLCEQRKIKERRKYFKKHAESYGFQTAIDEDKKEPEIPQI